MPTRSISNCSSRVLGLLSFYAVFVTLSCSYLYLRDISRQLTLNDDKIDDDDSTANDEFYEAHFMPERIKKMFGSARKRGKANTRGKGKKKAKSQQMEQLDPIEALPEKTEDKMHKDLGQMNQLSELLMPLDSEEEL